MAGECSKGLDIEVDGVGGGRTADVDDVGEVVQGGGGAPRRARSRGGAARGRIGPGAAQDILKCSEEPRRSSEWVGNGRVWSGARDARAV